MKVTCQYSGVVYEVPNFANLKLTSLHPVFHANIKQLLSRAGDWSVGRLTATESRLLFLALLRSSELVEFRTTALPAESTVAKNMEHLIRFISWSTGLSFPERILPRFAVTPETADLINVNHWLEAWETARAEFNAGYIPTSQLSKMRNREAALERLIKNSTKKVDDYSGMLASWAMDAANVPQALREYWTQLMCLKGVSIYSAKEVDLEELVEHMLDNLDHGSIYSSKTLNRCKELLAKRKQGMLHGLGLEENSDGFTIIEDSLEAHNRRITAAKAPAELPVEADYPTKLAYLRAKAAWDVAQSLKQQDAAVEAEMQRTEDANDSSKHIDDDDDDDAPDVVDFMNNPNKPRLDGGEA